MILLSGECFSCRASDGFDYNLLSSIFIIAHVTQTLIFDWRYFTKELQPKGAIEKSQLPSILSTWVDKTSPLCMYNLGQICAWSLPHLKTSSWYIDCDKGFYLEEEEELKASIDTKNTATRSFLIDEQFDKGDDNDANLAKMSKKNKKKEVARTVYEAKKEKKNNNKEAECAKEKARKGAVKADKKVEGSSKMSKDVDATPSASDQVPKIYPSISQVTF